MYIAAVSKPHGGAPEGQSQSVTHYRGKVGSRKYSINTDKIPPPFLFPFLLIKTAFLLTASSVTHLKTQFLKTATLTQRSTLGEGVHIVLL